MGMHHCRVARYLESDGEPRMSLQDDWSWNSTLLTWDDLNVSWDGRAAVQPANAFDLTAGYTSIYRR